MIIKPISDLRNTNAISEQAHKSNQPIFITKNGYGDMVVMSMELYEAAYAGVATEKSQPAVEVAVPEKTTKLPIKEKKLNSTPYSEEIEDAALPAGDEEPFSGLNSIRERYLKK